MFQIKSSHLWQNIKLIILKIVKEDIDFKINKKIRLNKIEFKYECIIIYIDNLQSVMNDILLSVSLLFILIAISNLANINRLDIWTSIMKS